MQNMLHIHTDKNTPHFLENLKVNALLPLLEHHYPEFF